MTGRLRRERSAEKTAGPGEALNLPIKKNSTSTKKRKLIDKPFPPSAGLKVMDYHTKLVIVYYTPSQPLQRLELPKRDYNREQ